MSGRVSVFLGRSVAQHCARGFFYQNKLRNLHVFKTNIRNFNSLTFKQIKLAETASAVDFEKAKVKHLFTGKNDQCPTNINENEKKPSVYERLKIMYKEYWYVLVPVHVATSILWYGGFYYLCVSGVDIAGMMEFFGAPETWVEKIKSSKAGHFVAAYTLYKLATPARYTVTLGGTTVSITYLKKWGWIKPIPNTEKLKQMYEEQKVALKDLKTSYQDKMQVTTNEIKDEFIKTHHEMKQHYVEAKEGFQKSVADTKYELKEGVREASREWQHVGGLVKKATTQVLTSKNEQQSRN